IRARQDSSHGRRRGIPRARLRPGRCPAPEIRARVMADTDRIKRNLGKMIDQGAPEADLNGYLASEGFKSPEEWKTAIAAPTGGAGRATARIVGQGAQGFNDAVADTVGAPVDAINWISGKLGGPRSDA